jgi:cytochrome c oxidase subunit 2
VIIAIYALRIRGSHSQRAADLLVVGGGVAAPTIVLGALVAYGMPIVPQLLAVPPADGLSIHITGKQWWWRVEYLTPSGRIETANELRLPLNRRVLLELRSPDVIHSFWVPSLAGKMDMIPGRVTRIALEPTRPGTFRGACAEFCGASHALMAFTVTVMEGDGLARWLESQAAPARIPADQAATLGQHAFFAHGCSACHTIRGTAAAGRVGPDLTHVASRAHLAADTLPNTPDALVRWIRQAEEIKPGVHMPAFRALGAGDLTALAAYLGSLR